MNLKSKKVVISATIAGALVITPAAMAIQSTLATPGSHGNSNGSNGRGGYGAGAGNGARDSFHGGGGGRRADHDSSANSDRNPHYESHYDGESWVWVRR
jgi:hypothetical protein